MGKTKITVVGDADEKEKASSKGRSASGRKKSLKKEKGVRVPGLKGGERVVAVGGEVPAEEPEKDKKQDTAKAQSADAQKRKIEPRQRGKKYLAARAKVDPQKSYAPDEAAKLVKETSISRFNGSVELHLVFAKDGVSATAELPHSTGQKKRIEVASDETIKKLKAGKIDFDVLLATVDMMSHLVPFAKILGPRGLMPNPKNGTLVENPEKAAAQFGGNRLQLRTEKKAPLAHLVVAKADQPEKEIAENLEAVLSAVGPKNIKKAVVSASMGPGIRVTVA